MDTLNGALPALLEILLKQSLVTRSAILAALLALASAPAVAHAAKFGPGGGIPCPIGQGGKNGFGPGGGIPVPIGQGGKNSFGPGGGIPCPIGHGKGARI